MLRHAVPTKRKINVSGLNDWVRVRGNKPFPSFRFPIFQLGGHPNVLLVGAKNCPRAWFWHFFLDKVVDFFKQREEIRTQIQVCRELPRFYQIRSVEEHPKPNHITSRVQPRQLKPPDPNLTWQPAQYDWADHGHGDCWYTHSALRCLTGRGILDCDWWQYACCGSGQGLWQAH